MTDCPAIPGDFRHVCARRRGGCEIVKREEFSLSDDSSPAVALARRPEERRFCASAANTAATVRATIISFFIFVSFRKSG
jgi:hypothetical protein